MLKCHRSFESLNERDSDIGYDVRSIASQSARCKSWGELGQVFGAAEELEEAEKVEGGPEVEKGVSLFHFSFPNSIVWFWGTEGRRKAEEKMRTAFSDEFGAKESF